MEYYGLAYTKIEQIQWLTMSMEVRGSDSPWGRHIIEKDPKGSFFMPVYFTF